MSRMEKEALERENKELKERLERLEGNLKTLGNSLDSNANVLRLIVGAVNILSKKVGVSYAEVQQTVLDELAKNLAGISLQSTGTGATSSDSGSQQPDILRSAVDRTVEGIVGIEGQAEGSTSDTGDFSGSDGQAPVNRDSDSGTEEGTKTQEPNTGSESGN